VTTAYTSLLGLALPVTGELSGTWGDVVNNSITNLLDSAIAGTTTISVDADVTLTTTTGAANTSREAILLWTASGTVTRTITAPAQSKVYIVINKTGSTQSIKLVGVGPTTGVTIVAGESAVCAWNGTDFSKVATTATVSSFSAGTTGLTPSTASTGAITLAGTLGTANGGTGLATFTSNGIFFASSASVMAQSSNLTWDGSYLTVSSIKNSALTNTRLTFAGASGLLSDSANLTWSGTALNVTGTVAVTGALTATLDSTFSSTGALTISKGTTAQRAATPVTGMLRYNSTTNEFEGYSGSSPSWKSVGGSAISNDTSTSTNIYPLLAAATSGTAQNVYTSNAKLLYKPSTGEFTSSILNAGNGIVVNNTTVSASYTIDTNNNGFSVGPVTVATGQSVTVSSGQRWVVL
jgi:hypothetical protein